MFVLKNINLRQLEKYEFNVFSKTFALNNELVIFPKVSSLIDICGINKMESFEFNEKYDYYEKTRIIPIYKRIWNSYYPFLKANKFKKKIIKYNKFWGRPYKFDLETFEYVINTDSKWDLVLNYNHMAQTLNPDSFFLNINLSSVITTFIERGKLINFLIKTGQDKQFQIDFVRITFPYVKLLYMWFLDYDSWKKKDFFFFRLAKGRTMGYEVFKLANKKYFLENYSYRNLVIRNITPVNYSNYSKNNFFFNFIKLKKSL